MRHTAIIAHRGASALAKHENTLESFQIAIDLHADYVEFDIRQTKDEKLVVFHNDNLRGKPLSAMSYKEICQESARDGYRVPLLYEVLALCQGKIKLDIELKETGYEQQIIRLVKKYYDYPDYMMKSFLDISVARIKQIDSRITAGLLLGYNKGDFKRRINEYFPEKRIHACHADFVSPHYQLTTRPFIRRMHIIHRKVYVWTVNDAETIGKFIKRRVDGVITDRPDYGLEKRKKIGKRH